MNFNRIEPQTYCLSMSRYLMAICSYRSSGVGLLTRLIALWDTVSWLVRRQPRLSAGIVLGGALFAGQASAVSVSVDYQAQIQPLFDRYCVACHACFDAPCQLDLTHAEGVNRGASRQPIYDATRLEPVPPTRLFIDGHGAADWKKFRFFSVTKSERGEPAILERLLELKDTHPLAAGKALPDGLEIGIRRNNQCVAADQIDAFAEEHPQLGMPFALPGMRNAELELMRLWIRQGAVAVPPPLVATASEKRQIALWETWLNVTRPERVLVARWLFEHWAIARLYFDGGRSGHFFRLVRSATPPGQTVAEIATRRPNSDPGQAFTYRFKIQPGTRVYKTHITFALNDALLEHIGKLFFASNWRVTRQPGYSARERSNPFATFAAIPASARYRFMLDHAGYFVRTFIRGPVCRGQLATDVIRDHFWVMFQAPASDPYILDEGYRKATTALLDLPGLDDDLLAGAKSWLESAEDRNRYIVLRQKALRALGAGGPGMVSIWDGDGKNRDALLTIFRHHDSATVKRGWLGQQPLTVWWLDYPLFERSYYNLVVNFDVFGNLAHQAQTRLYFDLIRNGAEQNFLRLLPAASRQEILDVWYRGSGMIKLWMAYQSIDTRTPSGIEFRSDKPQRELLSALLTRFADLNSTADPINRPGGSFNSESDALLSKLSGTAAAEMPAIRHLPEASILRVTEPDGRRHIYSLIRNRRHSNVAFVLGESLRYVPEEDEISVVPGVATGYPNFMFHVPIGELKRFVRSLRAEDVTDKATFAKRIVATWGVLRSAPEFWKHFHDVNRFLVDTQPVQAGILDLNRYVDF